MRRDVDREGRSESAGPLFDCAPEVERIFPREVAEMRRDLGMARAAQRGARVSPGWEVEACAQVLEYAKTHEHFATEDVRAVYGTPEGINPKAWGSVLKRAHRIRIVEPDGFVLVNCSNRSPRVRWKSLVFEEGVGTDV